MATEDIRLLKTTVCNEFESNLVSKTTKPLEIQGVLI